ncbi:hypothetical protein P8785_02025, partial [Bacillus subtilis]|uniref:hypothetical protein n=1 Tax=Bacillus subtilis TaxID=1423 RepID=UPI002DBC339E
KDVLTQSSLTQSGTMEIRSFMATKNRRENRALKNFTGLLHSSKIIVKKWMLTTSIQMSLFFFS